MFVSKKRIFQVSALVAGVALVSFIYKPKEVRVSPEPRGLIAPSVPSVHSAPVASPAPALLFDSDLLTLRAMHTVLESGIWLNKTERISGDPVPADYVEFDTETEYSVAYRIYDITARHPNELYIVGVSRWADTLVERWDFLPRFGESYTTRDSATPAVGVAVPKSNI